MRAGRPARRVVCTMCTICGHRLVPALNDKQTMSEAHILLLSCLVLRGRYKLNGRRVINVCDSLTRRSSAAVGKHWPHVPERCPKANTTKPSPVIFFSKFIEGFCFCRQKRNRLCWELVVCAFNKQCTSNHNECFFFWFYVLSYIVTKIFKT